MNPKLEQKLAQLFTMCEEFVDGGKVDSSAFTLAVTKPDMQAALDEPEVAAWIDDMRERGLCRRRRHLCRQ